MTSVEDITNTPLTHWSRGKMAAISQATFSNAFSWILLKYVPKVPIQYSSIGSDYLHQWWLVYRRIYICVTRPQLWVHSLRPRDAYICVNNLIIIGSDNGLSPGRRQAIIWTNAGILFIGPIGTNFSEILIEILTFSFKKMRLKVSSGIWRPFCRGLNVLTTNPGQK